MVVFAFVCVAVAAGIYLFIIGMGISDGIKRGNEITAAREKADKQRLESIAKLQKTADEANEFLAERERRKKQIEEVSRQNTAEEIDQLFCEVGWHTWDQSVHLVEGQVDRYRRGLADESITILDYDEDTKNAAVSGKSGSAYRTCENSCTCRDYQSRNLPCKHMYYLAWWLMKSYKQRA